MRIQHVSQKRVLLSLALVVHAMNNVDAFLFQLVREILLQEPLKRFVPMRYFIPRVLFSLKGNRS